MGSVSHHLLTGLDESQSETAHIAFGFCNRMTGVEIVRHLTEFRHVRGDLMGSILFDSLANRLRKGCKVHKNPLLQRGKLLGYSFDAAALARLLGNRFQPAVCVLQVGALSRFHMLRSMGENSISFSLSCRKSLKITALIPIFVAAA